MERGVSSLAFSHLLYVFTYFLFTKKKGSEKIRENKRGVRTHPVTFLVHGFPACGED